MILPGTVIYAAAGSSEVSLYLNNVLQKTARNIIRRFDFLDD